MTKIDDHSKDRTKIFKDPRITPNKKSELKCHRMNNCNAFMQINASCDGVENTSKEEMTDLRVCLDLHNTTSSELKAELCTGIVKLLQSIGERHGKPLTIEAWNPEYTHKVHVWS